VTIRLRLAVAFTLLVGLILLLTGAVTYQLLRHSLLAEIQQDVVRRAQSVSRTESPAPKNLNPFAAPDVFVQVDRANGTVAARSANLGTRTLPAPPGSRGRAVEARVGGRPLFVSSAALPGGSTVIVARSPLSTYRALAVLNNLLNAVTAGAMLLTALASWLYARAALRPIDRLVRAAGAVRDSRDLTQRVSHRGPPDELGRLVATFNGMLAELDAAYRSLDRSNERMRQFLADCSHELRAPLTRVRSAMDLLSRLGDEDPEFRSRTITAAATETDRMSTLVRNLLLLARADAGANIQRRPVRLADVLTAAGDRAGRMGDSVTLHTPAAGQPDGVVVDGDADHLEQLVLILLDNAFKYTPPPGEVWLGTLVTGTEVVITVRDTGLGIPAGDLPHVFDRFYRGRNANTASGTGLGLAIARWIASQHGGRIDAASTPGEGSAFTIHLPLAQPPI
jgi:two-component system, OmpR family, sensor kinase